MHLGSKKGLELSEINQESIQNKFEFLERILPWLDCLFQIYINMERLRIFFVLEASKQRNLKCNLALFMTNYRSLGNFLH